MTPSASLIEWALAQGYQPGTRVYVPLSAHPEGGCAFWIPLRLNNSHRTVAEFLSSLEKQNITLAEWSRKNKLDMQAVYTVCNGRALGRRGKTREVMKAMGLPLPPMHTNGSHSPKVATAGVAA